MKSIKYTQKQNHDTMPNSANSEATKDKGKKKNK